MFIFGIWIVHYMTIWHTTLSPMWLVLDSTHTLCVLIRKIGPGCSCTVRDKTNLYFLTRVVNRHHVMTFIKTVVTHCSLSSLNLWLMLSTWNIVKVRNLSIVLFCVSRLCAHIHTLKYFLPLMSLLISIIIWIERNHHQFHILD
jgi:hypothetical protein